MQGSRHVVKLLNHKHAKKDIMNFIKNKREKFITEECIEGEIFAIETIVFDNHIIIKYIAP